MDALNTLELKINNTVKMKDSIDNTFQYGIVRSVNPLLVDPLSKKTKKGLGLPFDIVIPISSEEFKNATDLIRRRKPHTKKKKKALKVKLNKSSNKLTNNKGKNMGEYKFDLELCTNKKNKLILDPFVNTKNTPSPEKLILLHDNSCFDIDELAGHIIARDGYNIHPYSTPGMREEITWLNNDQLKFIINHPYLESELKDELIRQTNYVFNFNTRLFNYIVENPETLKLIGETALCLLADYTREYKPGQDCIINLKLTLSDTGLEDLFLDLRNFRGKTLSQILGSTGNTCLHGIGYELAGIYCYNFEKIMNLWDRKQKLSLEKNTIIKEKSTNLLYITSSLPIEVKKEEYVIKCSSNNKAYATLDINDIEIISKQFSSNKDRNKILTDFLRNYNPVVHIETPYKQMHDALMHSGYFKVNSSNFPLEDIHVDVKSDDIDKYNLIIFLNKVHDDSNLNINIYSPFYTNLSTGGCARIGEYSRGLYRVTQLYNTTRDTATELINMLRIGDSHGFKLNRDILSYYENRADLGHITVPSIKLYDFYHVRVEELNQILLTIKELSLNTIENYIEELGYPQFKTSVNVSQCQLLAISDFNDKLNHYVSKINSEFNQYNTPVLEYISKFDKISEEYYTRIEGQNKLFIQQANETFDELKVEEEAILVDIRKDLMEILETLPQDSENLECVQKALDEFRIRNIRLGNGENLCNARLWSNGCGLPCNRIVTQPNKLNLCKQHLDAQRVKYGLITKSRPEKFDWLPNSVIIQKTRIFGSGNIVYPIFNETQLKKSKNKKNIVRKKCSINKKGICELGGTGDKKKCIYDIESDSCKFSPDFLASRQKDVILVLQSNDDKNNAFDKDGDKGLFLLFNTMQDDFDFIYEKISTIQQAIDIINSLNKHQHIAHLIFMAHGNKNLLKLSEHNVINKITAAPLIKILYKKLSKNASILLHSCLCGQGGMDSDNIANFLAINLPYHKIFASTREINRGNLQVNKLISDVHQRVVDGLYTIAPERGYKIIEFYYNMNSAAKAKKKLKYNKI